MIYRVPVPFTQFNNDLVLTKDQRELYARNYEHFNGKSYVHPLIPGGSNDRRTYTYSPFLTHSFLYLVTETTGEYPHPYFSEKTWKGINTGCPFMIVGSKNSLAKLREFGFKTFSQWWDESYDQLDTVGNRIEAIVTEVKKLSALSITELEQLRSEMMPVLTHNQQHLKEFAKKNIENIRKLI